MTDVPAPTPQASPSGFPRVVTNDRGARLRLDEPGTSTADPGFARGNYDPNTYYEENGQAWGLLNGRADAESDDDVARDYARRVDEREDAALDQEAADVQGEASFWSRAGDVAGDVATGLFVEGGQAASVGIRDGLNETYDLIDELHLTPVLAPHAEVLGRANNVMEALGGPDDFVPLRLGVGEEERPDTVTGAIVENLAQFATGWATGGRVLGVAGASARTALGAARTAATATGAGTAMRGLLNAARRRTIGFDLARGAIADFTAFDGQEARLSNLLADIAPEQARPIFDFLAANEDDPELLGRAKAAIEGMGLGVAAEAVFTSVRGVQAWRRTRREVQTAARQQGLQAPVLTPAEETARAAEEMQAGLRTTLGGPEAPLVSRREIARPVGDAEAATVATDLSAAPRVADLTGEEIAPAAADIGTLRSAARQWYQANLRGQAVRSDALGGDVRFTAARKSFSDSANPDKLRTFPALREAVERGRLISSEPDRHGRPGVRAMHTLEAVVRVGDREAPLRVLVREDSDGSLYYTHQTGTREGRNPQGLGTPPFERGPGTSEAAASDPSVVDNVFNINFARINTPDDVQATIANLADRYAGDIDLARRGTRSWTETAEAARGVDWIDHMQQRRVGDALNAEQILAYRTTLNGSATRVLEMAREVRTNPSLANQAAFRRMLSVHKGVQEEFMGARAEAGRALNAFAIPVGAPERTMRQLDALLAEHGGRESTEALAQAVLDASRRGDGALNDLIQNGALARSRDIIRLVYTNSLLSGVATPMVNVLGNAGALTLNLAARSLAPRLSRAFGGTGDTQVGEALAMVEGYMGAVRDAFRLTPMQTADRIRTDIRREGVYRSLAPGLRDAMPEGIGPSRQGREEAGAVVGADAQSRPLSSAAWRVEEDTPLGRLLDTFQLVLESPSNLNALGDDFFRLVAARGELHAQAHRRTQRALADGEITPEEAAGRMRDLLDAPDEAMLTAAEREMTELTFTRQTPGIVEGLMKVRRAMDDSGPVPFGSILMPFIRTPANLISMAMRYSPLAFRMRRYAQDMAEGGARAEVAKAQWALGTAAWSVFMGMAADGAITGGGPQNRAQREALTRVDPDGNVTWQPYSIRVGDRWFSYERLDPLGTSLSLIGDIGEVINNTDWDQTRVEDIGEIGGHTVAALGQAFFNKTMLKSVFEFVGAVTSGDPGESERFFTRLGGSLVPASGALRMFRRGQDPYMREVSTVVDGIRNTIPGLSDDLPAQRDLWGRPRDYQTGLGSVYDSILPVRTRAAGGSAIDLEILDNGVTVQMPQRSISVSGERVNLRNRPDIYSEFVRLSGEPAFEHLNAVASGFHEDSEAYFEMTDGPDGERAAYIKDVITAYREEAREQVLETYRGDLEDMLGEQMRRRQDVRGR